MSRKLLGALAACALLVAAVPAVDASRGYDRDRSACGKSHRGLDMVGLTADQRLICFDQDEPRKARKLGRITGLNGDARLVGIDYRPATGDLYGLGDAGGVYVVDDRTAEATLRSRLSEPLTGTSFGVDFNPTVDRLRIVSDTGQNLRDNVDANGDTLKDGTLTYPGPPPVTATGVTAAAYTNNDADPNTATTLFDLDTALDQTVVQSPANAGLLAPTGKLGVDAGLTAGFDIYSVVRDGTTVGVRAFASLNNGGKSALYKVNLLQGRVTPLGTFASKYSVVGIAIPTNQR
jgi:Domain of unknown function (DUF4394)